MLLEIPAAAGDPSIRTLDGRKHLRRSPGAARLFLRQEMFAVPAEVPI